jgi:hypothetical protein
MLLQLLLLLLLLLLLQQGAPALNFSFACGGWLQFYM